MPFRFSQLKLTCYLFVVCLMHGLPIQQNILEAGQKITLKDARVFIINEVQLASDIPGIIEEMNAKEGDKIEGNKVVVRLNDDSAKIRLEIAQEKAKNDIDVKFSKIAAEVAKNEHEIALEANRNARKKGIENIVPSLEIERLELSKIKSTYQIEKSEMELRVAKMSVKEAIIDLEKFTIKTPFSGVVTKVLKHPGEAVRQGEPILEMVNTDLVRVQAEISFKYINQIKVGQKISVTNIAATFKFQPEGTEKEKKQLPSEIKNKNFVGRISFVDVRVISGRGTVYVWAEVKNQNNILREGLVTDMIIELN